MKKIKSLLLVAAFASAATISFADDCSDCDTTDCCKDGCTTSQNLWQPHAFSVSMSREALLQKAAWTGASDDEGWHGTFGVGFEYMQNWGESKNCDECPEETKGCCRSLGAMPFWASDLSNEMTIGDNSGTYDLDAYQMGLGPVTTTGTVRLDPKVFQTGGDFFLYVGAHRTERGFFAKIHGPVGVTSVDPKLSHSDTITPVAYPIGALALDGSGATTTAAPYASIQESFVGDKTAGFLKKMQYGKIDCKQTTSAKFGDLAIAVGYNVYADDKKHLGLALRFSAPTGNKAEGIYVLEPIWGRNGHWAAGGELIGHWRAWESDSSDNYLDLWLDGTAEHVFRSRHLRSFDLKSNGAGSKYLLVGKYTGGVSATFQNCIENAINVTTLPVESSFDIEGNFVAMADFHFNGWSMALGYEGWGRTCEKLKIDCKCPGSVNLNDYAVLGRQTPYSTSDSSSTVLNNAEPLATISKSQDQFDDNTGRPTGVVDATDPANRIPEDVNEALDICGQRAHKAYTSKVFLQVAHTWKDSDYDPYLGVSGAAEFSHTDNSAVRFWSVGVQGGLAF